MPATAEHVFLLLKEKKYGEIIPLINQDENLVNAIYTQDGRSLLQMLINITVTEQSSKLLHFVLTHPKLNFSYENTECGLTNLDDMISSVNLELFLPIIQNPQILFNRDKLTYESAKEYLIKVESSHQKNMQKNPNSEISKRSKARLERQGEIIELLRDATILYAIKEDDTSLMDKLEQSGATPTNRLGKLGNEELPSHLLTDANTNLTAWFKTRFDQCTRSIATNPNSFHNRAKEVERIEAQLAALKIEHVKARTEVHQKAIESDKGFIDRVISSLS